jgi:hypothetical protein
MLTVVLFLVIVFSAMHGPYYCDFYYYLGFITENMKDLRYVFTQ